MNPDHELLKLAAKAVGYPDVCIPYGSCKLHAKMPDRTYHEGQGEYLTSWTYRKWNPLTDDGDALRLGVKLQFSIDAASSFGQATDMHGKVYRVLSSEVGNSYKKHFLGLSDNVTYFIEQVEPFKAGSAHYAVNFKPSAILPDIQVR